MAWRLKMYLSGCHTFDDAMESSHDTFVKYCCPSAESRAACNSTRSFQASGEGTTNNEEVESGGFGLMRASSSDTVREAEITSEIYSTQREKERKIRWD